MVTKHADAPVSEKQKRGRPSGYNRKFSLGGADPEKRERMQEYLRIRTLIRGWSKRAQTCGISELLEIERDAGILYREMKRKEPVVLMIFKEDFEHIEEVVAARLRDRRNRPGQP